MNRYRERQEFAPDPRPSGTIVLENTNAGALQLKAPKAVAASLGARLDGEDNMTIS